MIDIKNVTKEYKREGNSFQAVKNVNLFVEKGDYISIVGRSGSGKSTLLNIMTGFLKPDFGQVVINTEDIFKKDDKEISFFRNRKINYIPQGNTILSNLTVVENVALPFFISKNEGSGFEKAHYILDKLGLEYLSEQYPKALSGGEIKRVLIARAIVNNPEILIADEPTGSLDIKSSKEVMEIFSKINTEGTTVVMVTHEQDTLKYSKKVYTMIDGELFSGNKLTV